MQEKQAIITLNYIINNDELYSLLRQVCVPSIRAYAKRMNIDFILMNNNNNIYNSKNKQLQCLEYLNYYDKILYIDGDCYIPKLFNINMFNRMNNNCKSNNYIGMSKNLFPTYHIKGNCHIYYPFVILLVDKVMGEFIKSSIYIYIRNNL